MLYVQQSLGPNEEIVMAARFHWMYTLQAIFWILFGLAMGIIVGYASIWWVVSQEIRDMYGGADLDDKTYHMAWQIVVIRHKGYLRILWELHWLVRFGILGLFMIGMWFFAHMMVVKATTEIAVTTERLIHKGLIERNVGELNVDRIEGVSVRQDVLGRMFGYGRVCVRGMGVGEVPLPPIEQPLEFKKAIADAKVTPRKSGVAKASGDDF